VIKALYTYHQFTKPVDGKSKYIYTWTHFV